MWLSEFFVALIFLPTSDSSKNDAISPPYSSPCHILLSVDDRSLPPVALNSSSLMHVIIGKLVLGLCLTRSIFVLKIVFGTAEIVLELFI